ncbi:NEDD4-binding protein 1-like [Chelonus insularis]|uniref:NEDD4-binding protein 1-like n=1 Tax=Chelonus insularis TaxID=460826 RepID=UPI0015892BB5|nr:NEDD4-binding protein 1-like [Chelonus insularis]XP_034942021.1 NEDD4-binding protein 1-like [Chelonus insularis]
MFYKTLKRKQKYLKIITMKSPKMSVKVSGKRRSRVIRKNPLRKVNKRNSNNIIIDTVCNKKNAQSRTPLRTVYTGSIAKNGDKNGCYNLSMSNSRKRSNKSKEFPPSKRRKTIDLCETIVLSDDDDDDDDDNHHDNINNNGGICYGSTERTELSRSHENSDIILSSPSPKNARRSKRNRNKSIKKRRSISNSNQDTANSANDDDSKDGDEVCVIWSSTCTMPNEDEIKLEQASDHNGEKYFFDTVGDKSNFFKLSLFPVNKTIFTGSKRDEKECSNNNNNNDNTVNISSPSPTTSENELSSRKLREIVVDGLNVTYGYTRKKVFSKKGLQLVLDYFRSRGHDVKIFIPQFERSRERQFLEDWYLKGYVIFTPSRRIAGKKIISHDDRFILDYATKCKGIVVSSDQYRDLWKEKPEWRETIEFRLLPPTFVGDYVMFPEDPLGRSGPRLDEFLRH